MAEEETGKALQELQDVGRRRLKTRKRREFLHPGLNLAKTNTNPGHLSG